MDPILQGPSSRGSAWRFDGMERDYEKGSVRSSFLIDFL